MGCDILVALSRATRDGGTLFGHNCNRPDGEDLTLLRVAGRSFCPGEMVRTDALDLPQTRQTWTVLASRCPGQWGYPHGLNEHGVCIGLTSIRTKRRERSVALTGPDLVRLGLERANSARQAVDVMTDLVSRYGQGSVDEELDPSFLIADGREAFVVEMFGPYWAMQHVGEVRAVSDVCHLRRDWDQLSHGLADLAIERGWWPADGSKLDFAGSIALEGDDNAASLRRWGRATLLLEQANGRIDVALPRRILSDHFEDCAEAVAGNATTLCQHAATPFAPRTAASFIAQLEPNGSPPIAWYSFGPPCLGVYFPLFLMGELPIEYQSTIRETLRRMQSDSRDQVGLRAALDGLQDRFDRETREFVTETIELRQRGQADALPRLAELFALHNLECLENVCEEFVPISARSSHVQVENEYHSSGAWS